MAIIWNQHHESITTSKMKVDAEGLANYRASHPEKDYFGYFDISRSAQYLLGFVNADVEDDHLYINQMAVYEDVRGRGIGTKLLDFMKEQATKIGKPIVLSVQVINLVAVKFYLQHGFVIENCIVEQDYTPKGYDPCSVDDIIRLVEYRLRFDVS